MLEMSLCRLLWIGNLFKLNWIKMENKRGEEIRVAN